MNNAQMHSLAARTGIRFSLKATLPVEVLIRRSVLIGEITTLSLKPRNINQHVVHLCCPYLHELMIQLQGEKLQFPFRPP